MHFANLAALADTKASEVERWRASVNHCQSGYGPNSKKTQQLGPKNACFGNLAIRKVSEGQNPYTKHQTNF